MEARATTGNVELRAALERALQHTSAGLYKAAIERLKSVHRHNVMVLAHNGPDHRKKASCCYGFAFGVQPLSSASVTTLLQNGALRHRRSRARNGDVVLYFNDAGQLQHAGVIIDAPGRIRSKWARGEVHEHDLWEVPLSYGNFVEACVPPSVLRILALLKEPLVSPRRSTRM
jgi:hypothetical protein